LKIDTYEKRDVALVIHTSSTIQEHPQTLFINNIITQSYATLSKKKQK